MGLTIIEKTLGAHGGLDSVRPGDIVDMQVDTRVARDFGGANVVNAPRDAGLGADDPSRTYVTFDRNPGGSDQKYAANQHICRMYAAELGIDVFDIDADMTYHNRYLAETDPAKMGQYAFDNLAGWEDFAQKVQPGDIIVTGANLGAGSSRAQAVDCFETLGVPGIVARSFDAIYQRNAINAAMPVITCDRSPDDVEDRDEIEVNLATGLIRNISSGTEIQAEPFAGIRLEIYRRGGLLRS